MSTVWQFKKYSGIVLLVNLLVALIYFPLKLTLTERWPEVLVIAYKSYDNRKSCYKSYAFESFYEPSYQLRLPEISSLAETVLDESGGNNIFFHQTDCIHNGILELSARQACAVESAALANPTSQVFLLYASQVGLLNDSWIPFLDVLLAYKNVHVMNVGDPVAYGADTPIGEWILKSTIEIFDTEFVTIHMADYLRFLSLYRFGGTSLDLDVIVLRDMSLLGENYAGANPNPNLLSTGVLNLGATGIGKRISRHCLMEFGNNYDPDHAAANGRDLLTATIKKFCNVTETSELLQNECENFRVFGAKEFNAIDSDNWNWGFEEEFLDRLREAVAESSVVHFNNPDNFSQPVLVKSNVGYVELAKMYCPNVFSSIEGNEF